MELNLNSGPVLLNQEDILKSFNTSQGYMIFYWDKDISRTKVFLKSRGKEVDIGLEIHSKIPNEILQKRQNITSLLSKINANGITISKANDGEYQWEVVPGLKGGGNIGVSINTWPLNEANKAKRKFIIPYTIKESHEMTDFRKSKEIQRQTRCKAPHTQDSKLEKEVQAAQATNEAIKAWNDTGLVELLPLEEFRKKYPNVSAERWIEFHTNNDEGICQSACIGMCPQTGALRVTCDLRQAFREDPARSMMHEIGHMIGLRHEHARLDRDEYVNSTLTEEDMDSEHMEAVGDYDPLSIMHYDFSSYPSEPIEIMFEEEDSCTRIRKTLADSIHSKEAIVVIQDVENSTWCIRFQNKNNDKIGKISISFDEATILNKAIIFKKIKAENGYIEKNMYLYLLQSNPGITDEYANQHRTITKGDKAAVQKLINMAIDKEEKLGQELKKQADRAARQREKEELEFAKAIAHLKIGDPQTQSYQSSSSSSTDYPRNPSGHFRRTSVDRPNFRVSIPSNPFIGIGNDYQNSRWTAPRQDSSTSISSSSTNDPRYHQGPPGYFPMAGTHRSYPSAPTSFTSSTIPDDYEEAVPAQHPSSSSISSSSSYGPSRGMANSSFPRKR